MVERSVSGVTSWQPLVWTRPEVALAELVNQQASSTARSEGWHTLGHTAGCSTCLLAVPRRCPGLLLPPSPTTACLTRPPVRVTPPRVTLQALQPPAVPVTPSSGSAAHHQVAGGIPHPTGAPFDSSAAMMEGQRGGGGGGGRAGRGGGPALGARGGPSASAQQRAGQQMVVQQQLHLQQLQQQQQQQYAGGVLMPAAADPGMPYAPPAPAAPMDPGTYVQVPYMMMPFYNQQQ